MINSGAISQTQSSADVYTDLAGVQAIHQLKDKSLALDKIAHQFESMMIRMMMKSMRSANQVFADGNMLSSHETDMYQSMLDDQLALTLSKGRGFGLADVLGRQLQGRFGDGTAAGNNSGQDKVPQKVQQKGVGELKRRDILPQPVPGYGGVSGSSAQSAALEFDGSVQQFVDQLYPLAQKAAQALGVSPEALIAQSALETGWGRKVCNRPNGESSLNFFNIKANRQWQGDSVSVPTLEIRGGVPVREQGVFRAYSSARDSFDDYVGFVSGSGRYEKALQSSDAESYIRALSEAGYATDTEYADKVIRIMNSPDLKAAVAKAATETVKEPMSQAMKQVARGG